MDNADLLLLTIDMAGLGFLIFFGWYVFIAKNDPGVVGLSISAIVSIQLISTVLDYLVG